MDDAAAGVLRWRLAFRRVRHLARAVANPRHPSPAPLDDQVLRRALDIGQVALTVAQNEGEETGVLRALRLLQRSLERVAVEHLRDEDVTRDADARTAS